MIHVKKGHKPLLLVILDGFGVSLEKAGNPAAEAHTPALDSLWAQFPAATLQASGIAVGLPWGKAGNSEVGHLTIGAGKIIYHHLPRISNAIHDGSFAENRILHEAAEYARSRSSRVHILGLTSPGSVHSYREHFFALIDFFEKAEVERIRIHAFVDGRDAPPTSGAEFLKLAEARMRTEWPHAEIATVVGRSYAMDRDENWGNIETAYNLFTKGAGEPTSCASEYVKESYAKGFVDEFVPPAVVTGDAREPADTIAPGDAVVFFNFREDSMREIVSAFILDDFDKFKRDKIPDLYVATLTEYKEGFPAHVVFPPIELGKPLAQVIGEAGLAHLHIAETEKYAHITYFLNGGIENPFPGEDRILIPSTETTHFDETPAMRAREITDAIIEKFSSYDVIFANFANADMIGHSGNYDAAIKTVEVLDECVKRLAEHTLATDAILVITADHGNIELKRNRQTGEKLTEHSLNPVPFIIVSNDVKLAEERTPTEVKKVQSETKGILIDVAPTVLDMLGIKKPDDMTGKSILEAL